MYNEPSSTNGERAGVLQLCTWCLFTQNPEDRVGVRKILERVVGSGVTSFAVTEGWIDNPGRVRGDLPP
jgi:hypothetical protein